MAIKYFIKNINHSFYMHELKKHLCKNVFAKTDGLQVLIANVKQFSDDSSMPTDIDK